LGKYVTEVLQEALVKYTVEELGERRVHKLGRRWDLGNKSFRVGVANCILPEIIHLEGFSLDPDSSRRYLNFGKQCWDRDTDSWVETRPESYISRSTEWDYEEFQSPLKDDLDALLAEVAASQLARGLHSPSAIPDELKERLDSIRRRMHELDLWYSFTRDWESTVFELSHLARGLFGVPLAEALHLRSSGRSVKDSIANLMEVIAGSYAYTVNYSTLCEVTPGDGPSTTLSRMRARPIVSVRETASGEKLKMRADVYKRIVDPFSKIVARPCFGTANIVYSPQHLVLFCSNQPMQIDDSDEAVRARTTITDHTDVDCPTEDNHSQRLDLSRDVLVAKYRTGTFWLLQRVYRHLLHNRVDRNIRPVPEQCGEP